MASPPTHAPFSLLLLSGGLGQRSEHHEPKQFYTLLGHPIIAHTLIAAMQVEKIAEIVVNAPTGYEKRTEEIMSSYCGTKPFQIIPPGKSRQESCELLAESASHSNVLVHEAARPFVDKNVFDRLIENPEKNAGYFLPLSFSICQISPVTQLVVRGVQRDEVSNVMLPQKFDRAGLLDSHKKAREHNKTFTEDAAMCVEMTGMRFKALSGESRNLKITTKEDFSVAEHMFGKING